MAKRFNIYTTLSNFLSERNLVSDELAVVNTTANDFPKGALFCKGCLISKPQIPFAGVIENTLEELPERNTTITNTNLYFLQDKNCFGIGNIINAADNTDKLEFKFQGQYVFGKNQVTNVTSYGLRLAKYSERNRYRLIPSEDFEYYIYDRPALTYRIVGNPDNRFCKLHTDYNLKPGDYLLNDGTILPSEYYHSNFNPKILGIVLNTEYRSFLPFPVITCNAKYIQPGFFDQSIINDLARHSINEHNGSNIFKSIIRYVTIDGIMSLARFAEAFPAIHTGYTQPLCKMYIPTVFEYMNLINDVTFLGSITDLDTSIIKVIMAERSFSTFANLEIANDNKDYINIIKDGDTFSRTLINDMSDFFFLGNY